jgi:hypothetical protein
MSVVASPGVLMRILVLLIGLPVSVGLCIVSMIANWRFGVRLGAEDGDAWAYGLASVCADGLKIILPFAIAWAWQRRKVAEWLAGACLWLVITAYSLVSALSFAAVNREEIAGRKLSEGRVFADLRIELETKRAERTQLPPARPIATIEAEIRSSEQQPRWSASRHCTDTATRDLRLYCERHFKLQAELGIARQAARLDGEASTIKARLDALPANAAARSADPQVDLFKTLSGLGEGTIKAALAVLVCLLIELGSGLGLFVVMSCHRALSDEAETKRDARTARTLDLDAETLAPIDADWARDRLDRNPGATMGAAELYADYRIWMEARGRSNALTVTAFGRWMGDLGLARDKVGGRIFYRGARLRPATRLIAP